MTWLKLTHKTAIVTGGGSGIGKAVAMALARQKCRVVLADINFCGIEGVEQEFELYRSPQQAHRAFQKVHCDVTSPDQVKDLFQQVDEFASCSSDQKTVPCSGRILINCAGITEDAFLSKMTLEQYDRVIDTNLRSTFLTCQAFCDPSRVNVNVDGSGGGAIVNVGSVVSEQGNIGQVNYAASKGGVLGLTRALAKEMASKNIRVNAVVPGFIDTDMVQAVPEKVRQSIEPKIALGRFGKAEDVANLILFLASCERSAYITGESIECSGMISL